MPWGTIILAVIFSTVLALAAPYFITGTTQSDLFFKQYIPYFSVGIVGLVLVFGWLGKHN